MNRQDAFSGYSPQVNFIFYIGTVFFTVLIVHPAFLICSLVLATVYYLQVRGRQGLRTIVGMIPVFVVVSAINPLLNTGGDRALFYLGQRPYTLEALYYGMALGCMFTAAGISAKGASDHNGPQVYRTDGNWIFAAKQTPAVVCGGFGFDVLGTGRGSDHGGQYAEQGLWKRKAKRVFHLFLCEAGQTDGLPDGPAYGGAVLRGGTRASYTPELLVSGYDDPWLWIGSICWFVFLSIPVAVDVVEEMRWHVLRSKI